MYHNSTKTYPIYKKRSQQVRCTKNKVAKLTPKSKNKSKAPRAIDKCS